MLTDTDIYNIGEALHFHLVCHTTEETVEQLTGRSFSFCCILVRRKLSGTKGEIQLRRRPINQTVNQADKLFYSFNPWNQ